jgi:hypothetical protein
MVNPVPAPGVVNPAPKPVATPAPAPGVVHVAGEKAETPEDKKPKEPKVKAEKKTGVSRPRMARPDENWVITVFKPGVKTGASGLRYDQYVNGMTVKQYVDLMTKEPYNRTVGQVYHTLRWDTDPNRKLINIGPEVVPIPPPPPPKEKKEKAAKAETEPKPEDPKPAGTAPAA